MQSIVISLVHYKDPQTTYECLDSIMKLHNKGISLSVMIANNNVDEQLDVSKWNNKPYQVELFESGENLGFSGGHNANIKKALQKNVDYVLVLNNDTKLDSSLVENLLQGFEEGKNVGVVVPKIYFYPGDEFHKDRYSKDDKGKVIWYAGGIIDWKNVISSHRGVDEVDSGQYQKAEITEYATGACMLISSKVLQTVGMFDEQYFLYYEDCDLSMRIIKSGYSIVFNPTAFLWHKNAKSTGGSGSGLQDYFITRNRMLFGMKYAPLRSKLALIRESMRLLAKGRENQKKGIKDFYTMRFRKGSWK